MRAYVPEREAGERVKEGACLYVRDKDESERRYLCVCVLYYCSSCLTHRA